MFQSFFQELFTTSNPKGIEMFPRSVISSVTKEININLTQAFSNMEIKEVVFSMNPLGSRGPDRFIAAFYQNHWNTVGLGVCGAILEALNHGRWSQGLNDTYIALIPKTKKASKVSEFRSNSLCNVFYEIIAKVLANRCKSILPYLISQTQSVFVPSRLITDNVIVAFESLHTIKTKMKGNDCFMVLKLDLSKAYDRVE